VIIKNNKLQRFSPLGNNLKVIKLINFMKSMIMKLSPIRKILIWRNEGRYRQQAVKK